MEKIANRTNLTITEQVGRLAGFLTEGIILLAAGYLVGYGLTGGQQPDLLWATGIVVLILGLHFIGTRPGGNFGPGEERDTLVTVLIIEAIALIIATIVALPFFGAAAWLGLILKVSPVFWQFALSVWILINGLFCLLYAGISTT